MGSSDRKTSKNLTIDFLLQQISKMRIRLFLTQKSLSNTMIQMMKNITSTFQKLSLLMKMDNLLSTLDTLTSYLVSCHHTFIYGMPRLDRQNKRNTGSKFSLNHSFFFQWSSAYLLISNMKEILNLKKGFLLLSRGIL